MIKYLFTILIVLVVCSVNAQSQNDSLKVSEEYLQEHDPNLILVRKDRKRAKFDEAQILRVSFGSYTTISRYGSNIAFGSIELGYERKIKESPFSVWANLAYRVLFGRSNILNTFGYNGIGVTSQNENEYGFNRVNFQLDLGVKYYYRQKRRLAKGVGGNNLNGSYLGVTVWNGISQVTQRNITYRAVNSRNVLFKATKEEKVSLASTLILLNWGNQIRILKRAYLDVNIGPVLNPSNIKDWGIAMNLKLGIALWKR